MARPLGLERRRDSRPPRTARDLGRGLGKHLLSCAVRDAWALAPSRVWLHTCTLDHPAALPNYEKRGFARYKTETYEVNFPP